MLRQDLFNNVKNSVQQYNTVTKIDSITEKIPTFFETDFKELVENPILCKIVKKYINSSEELQEKYKDLLARIIDEVPSDPIIIGVTGTWGKTTTCNMLYKYLRSIGKHACLLSSTKIENPFLAYESNSSNINVTRSIYYINDWLKKALISNPDYIIIEVHEQEIHTKRDRDYLINIPQHIANLKVGESLFQGVPFDLKICTSFEQAFLEFYTKEEYIEDVMNFIIPQENQVSFINLEACGIAENIYNECSSNNIKWMSCVNSKKYPVLTNTLETANKVYSKLLSFSTDIDESEFSFDLNGTAYNSILADKVEIAEDTILVASVLKYLNLFDKSTFDSCLNNLNNKADIIIKLSDNKKIIITQNNYTSLAIIYKYHETHPRQYAAKPANSRLICVQSSFSKCINLNTETYNDYLALKTKLEAVRKQTWINTECWKYLDKLIITNFSPMYLDKYQACNDVKEIYTKYIKDIPFDMCIIPDRDLAIKRAVASLQENDILIIGERGKQANYSYCDSNNKLISKVFTDEEIVRQTVQELGWEIIE